MAKKLSDSAKYYKNNPDAAKRKAETDKKINARPEQKAKRAELGRINRAADKRGVDRSGRDFDHAVGRYVKSSVNRGRSGSSGSSTIGDRNSRPKKKK